MYTVGNIIREKDKMSVEIRMMGLGTERVMRELFINNLLLIPSFSSYTLLVEFRIFSSLSS